MRKLFAAALLPLVIAGCARPAVVDTTSPAMAPAPPPATAAMLPAGTVLHTRLTQPLGTGHSQVGDVFTATVDQPIVAQNGATVIPQGAVLHGRVTGVAHSRSPGDPAAIRLDFDRITFSGHSHPMTAAIIDADVHLEDSERPSRPLEHAAAGAAAGAVVGAIIRGDLASILTGAALGAGAGTIISLGTGRMDATLPAGTRMNVQSTQTIHLH
jgi:hypothetical protein